MEIRSTQKALLTALLEPRQLLLEAEESGDYAKRLGILEDLKAFPMGSVWNYFCSQKNSALDISWIEEIKKYENEILNHR